MAAGVRRFAARAGGNAASHQRQLDIYGEVLDAAYQTLAQGIEGSEFGWSLVKQLLAWLADHWHEEDAGIWEVRGPLRDFTHSKMMAWVAFDRAVRIHDEFGRDGPVNRWRELRDEIKTRCSGAAGASASRPLPSRTDRTSSTPASCSCRSSASCRRTIHGSSRRSRRSDAS